VAVEYEVCPTAASSRLAYQAQTRVLTVYREATMMAGSWVDDPLGGGLIILLSVVWAVCAIARAVVRDDD